MATLVEHYLKSGFHEITFNTDIPKPLNSGIYICRITTDSYSDTRKLLLIK